MGIFDILFDDVKNKKKSGYGFLDFLTDLDKINKAYEQDNVDSWQKDLIDKGKYDWTSFDEEELEEDDYYTEDD